MKCGLCGSGVTAEEKFKKLKNDMTKRYVYYHCTRGKDRNCKERVIREEELLKQLLHMIDKVDIDDIGAKEKIQKEIRRYQKFSYKVLGKETEFDRNEMDLDIRNYAKYILSEGSKDEKKELLSCMRSKIALKDKIIYLNS